MQQHLICFTFGTISTTEMQMLSDADELGLEILTHEAGEMDSLTELHPQFFQNS